MIDVVSLEYIKQTLNLQEAKVIILMREHPYQTITVIMENGKVVHKERKESIKD
jgi:hypothetical protein